MKRLTMTQSVIDLAYDLYVAASKLIKPLLRLVNSPRPYQPTKSPARDGAKLRYGDNGGSRS